MAGRNGLGMASCRIEQALVIVADWTRWRRYSAQGVSVVRLNKHVHVHVHGRLPPFDRDGHVLSIVEVCWICQSSTSANLH